MDLGYSRVGIIQIILIIYLMKFFFSEILSILFGVLTELVKCYFIVTVDDANEKFTYNCKNTDSF